MRTWERYGHDSVCLGVMDVGYVGAGRRVGCLKFKGHEKKRKCSVEVGPWVVMLREVSDGEKGG